MPAGAMDSYRVIVRMYIRLHGNLPPSDRSAQPRQVTGNIAASLGQRTIFYHTRPVKPCQGVVRPLALSCGWRAVYAIHASATWLRPGAHRLRCRVIRNGGRNVHFFEIERGLALYVLHVRTGDSSCNTFRDADFRARFRDKRQDLRCDAR